jgi:hypothetical protein
MEKNALLNDWRDDLRREREFEGALARTSEAGFAGIHEDSAAWGVFFMHGC